MTDLDKKALLQEIDDINKTPIPKRWRLAHDFARRNNPSVRYEQDLFKQDIKKTREEQNGLWSGSKISGLRMGVSMPETTVAAIRAFDPEFLMEKKSRQDRSESSNKTVRTLAKMFPEYRVYREI